MDVYTCICIVAALLTLCIIICQISDIWLKQKINKDNLHNACLLKRIQKIEEQITKLAKTNNNNDKFKEL